ncbi:hypothetical protein CLAIMM_04730 [Cladophialophora immunda]|nr:hypothetical protein CLAIMM_04730 [Cladophialophora immunda]
MTQPVRPGARYENVDTGLASVVTIPSASTAPTRQELLEMDERMYQTMEKDLEEKTMEVYNKIPSKDTKEETGSVPSGKECDILTRLRSQTIQHKQPLPQKGPQRHEHNEEVEHKTQRVSGQASLSLSVNSSGRSYREALSFQTQNPGEPEMPSIACGRASGQKIIGPEPGTSYRHPSKLHYTAIHMFEAWREKGLECGLGEWRDLPDNPAIENRYYEPYSQYLRPWPPGANKVPFPICFYEPTYSKGSTDWPDLPPAYSKTGIHAGLVEADKGIHYSLKLLLSKHNKGPKPNYDPAYHRPYMWSPNPGDFPGEKRRRPKVEARINPKDAEKTGRPPPVSSGDEFKPLSPKTVDDGFRGVDHHPHIPNSGYDAKPQPPTHEQPPTKSIAQPTKDAFGCERSVGELQDPKLPVLVVNGERVDVSTLDCTKITAEERKHPGLRPKYLEEAQAHISKCIEFHNINMSDWKKASRYTQWFLEEWLNVERDIQFVLRQTNRSDMLEGRLSKFESDTRFKLQCEVLNDLGGSLLRRTKSHAQALEKQFESLKGSSLTGQEFPRLEKDLTLLWKDFNRGITTDLDTAFSGPGQMVVRACESHKAWLDEDDFNSTFRKATGGLLPQRSSEESILHCGSGRPLSRKLGYTVSAWEFQTSGSNKCSSRQSIPTRSVNKVR